ncbi:hypothetical protein BDC45DRAFT_541503 [Circinella umbellata]|nr:hypothetical protein BDC45DRAFT_541503 [Circinella umbellata]
MPKCPYSACRNHRFRNEKAVNAHLKSHDEPLPFTSFITTSQTVATDASTYQEQDEMFSSNEQYEYDDYSAYMSDDQSPSLESNNNNHQNALNKSTVISAVNIENNNEKSNNGNRLKLNEIELRFAQLHYRQGYPKPNIQSNPLKISTCTLDGLFTKIDAECRDKQVPFYEHEFDISSFMGYLLIVFKIFVTHMELLNLSIVTSTNFVNFYTVLLPEIWKRDGQEWSKTHLQQNGGMNYREHTKGHRNKGTNRATRVLAYFPILHCPNNNGKLKQRWSSIKCCIIHHCLRVILAPFANRAPYSTIPMKGLYNKLYQVVPALAAYIADLRNSERLMAGVKSGMSMYACPRCWTVTTKFHLPYYNTKLRKKSTMGQICKCGLNLIKAGKGSLLKKLSKKYSVHVVDILLSLIHDKVSSQAVLCLRHFIDFVYQAIAQEHSTDTIQQMQESLKLYNTYSPVIALYSKMGKFKTRFDAFFDMYSLHQKNTEEKNTSNTPASFQTTRTLSAPLNKERPISIAELQSQEELFQTLETKIRTYLDTTIMQRVHRRHVKNYPKLTSKSKKSADDGESYTEQFRASSSYRMKEWRDFAQIEGGYYGRLLLFFKMDYIKSDTTKMKLELCLIEPYIPVKDRTNNHIPHITGMEVLETLSVHVVPDYSSYKSQDGYYDQYLLNHDINAYCWSENEGVLLDPEEELMTWDDLIFEGFVEITKFLVY